MNSCLKTNNEFKKCKERYIYQSKLNKVCFQDYMTYGNFKDLPVITASDNVLRDRTFNVANNSKHDINVKLVQWFISKLIRRLPLLVLQMLLSKMKLCHNKN